MFHTPPIKPSYTEDEAAAESYTDPLRRRSSATITLSKEPEIKIEEDELPQELPQELDELIDHFLKDLKTPKYKTPLTPEQLSYTFQRFYETFHQKADLFVKGSVYYKKRKQRIEMQTSGEIEEEKRLNKRIEVKIRRYNEIAEEKICVELFERLFNRFAKDVKTNNYTKEKMRIIQKIKGINYGILLDIKDIELESPITREISHKFHELNNYKTPCSKLKVLVSIHSSINQFIKTQINSEFVDGDYFLPLLIYVILTTEDHIDFYSNFIYIKRFRQDAFLVEEPLYCLTNFEAALTFIQHLELTNDEFDYSELSAEELNFLKTKHEIEDEAMDIVIPSDRHILSNSTDGIKLISSAIDSSFKSMIHRFGSSNTTHTLSAVASPITTTTTTSTSNSSNTIPVGEDDVNISNEGYNPINKIVGVMKWRSSTPTPQPPPLPSRSRASSKSLPIDVEKFKNKDFKELKISELEELFNDYKALTKWVATGR